MSKKSTEVNRDLLVQSFKKGKTFEKAADLYNRGRKGVDASLDAITGGIVRLRLIEWGLIVPKKRAGNDPGTTNDLFVQIFNQVNSSYIGSDLTSKITDAFNEKSIHEAKSRDATTEKLI